MAWSRLGSTKGTGTTPSVDTSGATFIAYFVVGDNGCTCSDSYGNSLIPRTARGPAAGASTYGLWYYVVNPVVGSGHTASNSQSYGTVHMIWYTGQDTSPFDQENGGSSPATNFLVVGSVTPSVNNELLLAGVGIGGVSAGGYAVSGGGFSTILDSIDSVVGVTYGSAVAEVIQTSAAASNPTFTWNTITLALGAIETFKSAAGGGGGNPWYAYAQQRVKTVIDRRWERQGPLWTPAYSLQRKVA